MTRLVIIGDTLLDRDLSGSAHRLCPDAPVPVVDVDAAGETRRPGGAGLAALLARRDGHDVALVTALSTDAAGDSLRDLLARAGIHVIDLGLDGATPEKVRIRADGHTLLRLDSGGGGRVREVARGSGRDARRAIGDAPGVLVCDYGRGVSSVPMIRDAITGTRVVWDPHPRGALPVAGCALVTPNAEEASRLAPGLPGGWLALASAQAEALRRRWSASAVAITLGARGAVLGTGGRAPLVVPARAVACPDPCGAGDRFAVTAAAAIAAGALPSEAVVAAVEAATVFVGAGGAAAIRPEPGEPPAGVATAAEVARLTRARGGTVVATGGCFDIVHAGHVAMLEQARALGDCLVVLLNSDDSVRRLKSGRPVVPQADRAAVLRGLRFVDAVESFDDDTPVEALQQLRPDIWVKGGDYTRDAMPEADVVEAWGGRVAVLPYLPGRSTSAIVQEVMNHAG